MAERRFYWLKLKDDFFKNKAIKKLRKIAGGDTYTIIYLKMLLTGIKNDGLIIYEGIEPTLEEEVALDIDEDIENVKVTIAFLKSNNLLLETDNANEFAMPESMSNLGSESAAAERMRNMRNRNIVTQTLRTSYVEKEIEKEIEKREDSIINNTLVVPSVEQPVKDKKSTQIFNFWNDAKITVHKTLTTKLDKLIKKQIEFYGESKIKEAILNYARVYFDENYYFKHKWTLEEFLKQNNAMPDFFNEGSKWQAYATKNERPKRESTCHDFDDNGGFKEI